MHLYKFLVSAILIGLTLGINSYSEATVVTDNGITKSSKYKVIINGRESFVYTGNGTHFSQFSFADSAKVTIEMLRGKFTSVTIRPLSKNIGYLKTDKKISFTLHKLPIQLSVEFESDENEPLFLFANQPENKKPDPNDKKIFYFGPGVHEPDVIELTPEKKTVYLAKGAYVRGCIRATNLDSIKIYGRGILSGDLYENRPTDSEWHDMVSFKGCTNVQLNDIVLQNAHGWNILLLASNNIKINNIKVVATSGNSDGFDVCGARNVNVNHCFFYNNDDCVAFNNLLCSFKYDWEYGKMRPNTSNVQVLNCVMWNQSWGDAIKLGWNTMCNYQSNILFKNIDIIHAETKAIAMNLGDRGSFRNIIFDNINIENADQLLSLQMDGNRTCIDPVRGLSEANGIHFKNIHVTGKINNKKNIIYGHSKINRINNISFSNFDIKSKVIHSLSDLNCDTINVRDILFSDDKTKPSTPQINSIKAKNSQSIELNWQPSSDTESKIIYYNIYRNDDFLDMSETTDFADYSCSPSTKYKYKVTAINAAGLESDGKYSKDITTPKVRHKWVLSESIQKQTQGYNNFYYLNYNTKPMKFYRMPESGYDLADTRYSLSTLRFWDMFHDGINMWHSISNTRDTGNRIDATLSENGIIRPQENLDVVVAWKAPKTGTYKINTTSELIGNGKNNLRLSFALNKKDNLFDKTEDFKNINSGKRTKKIKLQKGDVIYFIGEIDDENNERQGIKLALSIKKL